MAEAGAIEDREGWALDGHGILQALLLGVGYAALALLSYRYTYSPELQIAGWWPPSGLALGLLVRNPRRRWPLLLGAVFAGGAAALLYRGLRVDLAVCWSVADVVEPLVAASVIRRFVPTCGLCLERLREVLLLALAGGLIGPLAGTLVASTAGAAFGGLDGVGWWRFALAWGASGTLGAVGIAPLLLTLPPLPLRRPHAGRVLEALLLGAAIVLFSGVLVPIRSEPAHVVALAIVTFPVLTWAALRFGPRGAAWGAAAVAFQAIFLTLNGLGPFTRAGSVPGHLQVVFVQVFFVLAALTALVLAALATERKRAALAQGLLARTSAILAEATPLDRRLAGIAEEAVQELCDAFLIWVGAPSSGPIAAAGSSAELLPRAREIAGELDAPGQRCIRWSVAICVAAVPIAGPGGLEGTLFARATVRRHYFDQAESEVIESLAGRIGHAVERDRIERAAAADASQLARSELRFRSLAEAAAQVVWTADAEGRLLESPSARQFTGQTREAFVGAGWTDRIHPEDREGTIERWSAAVRNQTPYVHRFRVQRWDGAWRHLEVRGVPVRDAAGRVIEWVGMSFDETERVEAEEERARLYEEAQEAVRLRDEFLSVASHELKTPLTPLAARLGAIRRQLRAGGPIDPAALDKAQAGLARLTFLINDLLDVSRIQSGSLALHRRPVELDHVVQVGVEAAAGREADRVRIDLGDGPLVVDGDEPRLEQAVAALVDNAIKYSPARAPVEVALHATDGEAVITVADRGIGIPVEQQQHLFERFFRGRNAPSGSYGGLGLSLYIVRDIVERHGGRIWARSREGEGATFFLALPLLPREALLRGGEESLLQPA